MELQSQDFIFRVFQVTVYICILAVTLAASAILVLSMRQGIRSYPRVLGRNLAELFSQHEIPKDGDAKKRPWSALVGDFKPFNNFKVMLASFLWFAFFIDVVYEAIMQSYLTVPHKRGFDFSTCHGAVEAVRKVCAKDHKPSGVDDCCSGKRLQLQPTM